MQNVSTCERHLVIPLQARFQTFLSALHSWPGAAVTGRGTVGVRVWRCLCPCPVHGWGSVLWVLCVEVEDGTVFQVAKGGRLR